MARRRPVAMRSMPEAARDRTERAIANTTARLAVETIHQVMDHALRGQALNLRPQQVQALATVLSLAVPRDEQ